MINSALKDTLLDLGFELEELTDNASIRQDLQLDSTETVDISLGLKRRLGINIKLESRQDMTLAQVSEKINLAIAQSSFSTNDYVSPQTTSETQTAHSI